MGPKELEDRLVDFAVRIGNVVDALPNSRLGRHIAGQIVRSGTSPAPTNYAEGCAAESRRDFVHKLSISLKELRETRIWLCIIRKAELLPAARLAELLDETDQLGRIIASSILTARQNGRSH
jgi:four helix bundle protein